LFPARHGPGLTRRWASTVPAVAYGSSAVPWHLEHATWISPLLSIRDLAPPATRTHPPGRAQGIAHQLNEACGPRRIRFGCLRAVRQRRSTRGRVRWGSISGGSGALRGRSVRKLFIAGSRLGHRAAPARRGRQGPGIQPVHRRDVPVRPASPPRVQGRPSRASGPPPANGPACDRSAWWGLRFLAVSATGWREFTREWKPAALVPRLPSWPGGGDVSGAPSWLSSAYFSSSSAS